MTRRGDRVVIHVPGSYFHLRWAVVAQVLPGGDVMLDLEDGYALLKFGAGCVRPLPAVEPHITAGE